MMTFYRRVVQPTYIKKCTSSIFQSAIGVRVTVKIHSVQKGLVREDIPRDTFKGKCLFLN